ncbi:MAG: DEAD/DEAH box helicase [Pseudomonadota bacterium]
MLFQNLSLSAELLRAVEEQGYSEATPIQAAAIPAVLDGRDILASAQTGTGKTAGFTLPLLQNLMASHVATKRRVIRGLILVPTRELAIQVSESVYAYGANLPLRSMQIFGGVSIRPQISKLRKGVDAVVATPGRLLDHVQQGTIELGHVEMLVLDEADRMLDMGFIRDIKRVLKLLPAERQNLLFSATFSKDILNLASTFLDDPVEIEIAPRNTAAERVTQVIHPVDKGRKRQLLSFRIGEGNWRQVLVFTRTKRGANRLATQLSEDGLDAVAIHGNKSQGARTKALKDFKSGAVRILVATDIAARGLDIEKLPYVVNFDLPQVPEDYVHRIGRTARAGEDGHAVSLVAADERSLLREIEKLLDTQIPQEVIEGFAPHGLNDDAPRSKKVRSRRRRPSQSKDSKSNPSASKRATSGDKPAKSTKKRTKPSEKPAKKRRKPAKKTAKPAGKRSTAAKRKKAASKKTGQSARRNTGKAPSKGRRQPQKTSR